ncbi:MAG: protein kinase domain-containing protein [Geminicoccaceae bacterium]
MTSPAYVGRYEVREEIAAGGFAVVLKAWDEELESIVALKILHRNLAEDEEVRARFLEEARLLRRIRSPRVVTVHDVGRLNDGRPYFVMDYADRGTLMPRLRLPETHHTEARLDIEPLIDAIADGLAAIHEAGVVHRDIKPANILFQQARRVRSPTNGDESPDMQQARHLVRPDERILVGDLGIAKDLAKKITSTTMMAGTPVYQAPEQMDPDAEVTPAADIYGATAMMWHVVTGRPPSIGHRALERSADLPAAWRDCMTTGMAKEPGARFADIDQWRTAMRAALGHDVRSASADAVTIMAPSPTRCPYKGLAAYQSEDAEFFHGREGLVDEIVRRVQLNRVLIIGGPSGSGKSSLMRAGLIPAIRAGTLPGSDHWHVAVFTPGRDPLADLYVQLSRGHTATNTDISIDQVIAHPSLARYVGAATETPCLLCIDQFEELFTLTPPEQRQRFVDALSAMADPADSKVKIVLCLRADFYAACADIPWLADRISENQMLVGPMTGPELRRAITEPARVASLFLEDPLIDAVLEEAGGEAGSLPLVAHALLETWARREGNMMTLKGFREAGGVAGAISQTADALFEHRFDEQEKAATGRLFLRLITPGEGTPDTRRLLPLSEIDRDPAADVIHRVVESLTDSRLLIVDEDTVQIAHEALLRTWPRLRAWIEEGRDELRMRQRIVRAASDWETEERDTDLLYRGTRLLSAVEWADRNADQLGEREQEFLAASTESKASADAAAAERSKRRRRFRNIAIAGLAALSIGASIASVLAWRASELAEENRQRAERATDEANERFAGALGAAANGLADVDPLLATALGAEALARATSPRSTYEARAAMLAARRTLATDGPFMIGSPIDVGDALAIALDRRGALLAVGQREGLINLFDVKARRWLPPALSGHGGGVRDLAFGPNGERLASAGADGTVWLWTVGDRLADANRKLGDFDDVVSGIAFDSNGERVASAHGDGTVRLWNTAMGTQDGHPIVDWPLGFKIVVFAPDARSLVAGYNDGAIYGWSVPSRNTLFAPIIDIHSSNLSDLAISPDGDYVATASTDGTSALLAYPDGKILGNAFQDGDRIGAVAFADGGDVLLGGAADGSIRLWDVKRGEALPNTPRGHNQGIVGLETSGDGQLVATLGRDQQVRFWRFNAGLPLARSLEVAGKRAKGVAFSPDGQRIAAGDDAGVVRIFSLEDDGLEHELSGHEHQVWSLAFAPSGDLVASGDRAGNVRLWNSRTGRPAGRIEADDSAIWSLAFLDDASHLVIASANRLVLWDVQDKTESRSFSFDGQEFTRAALSSDGERLAAASTGGLVRIWNVDDGEPIRDIEADDNVVWSLAFSPDGQTLATASSDEVIHLWDLETGQRRRTFGGHKGGATDLAYLADGATLIAVDRSGELHWWDLATERRLTEVWQGHRGASWRLAVHPDGQRFATAGDDGRVKIWDQLSVDKACEIAGATFDTVRRRQYLGQDEPTIACKTSASPTEGF